VHAPSGALALEDEELVAKRESCARDHSRDRIAARRARRAGHAIEGTLTQRDENINHFNADANSEGTEVPLEPLRPVVLKTASTHLHASEPVIVPSTPGGVVTYGLQ
jgi:hypothetical protein